MIQFSDLEIKEAEDAFVGIKKNKENKYTFYLPIGYENAIDTFKKDSKKTKEFFFNLYKLMLRNQQKEQKKRDGVSQKERGVGGESKEHPIFYDSLGIQEILTSIDESLLLQINTKLSTQDEIDLSHIERYLDEAYFDKNHAPVILQTQQPTNVIEITLHDIVCLYSFIYADIKTQLHEQPPAYIKTFSQQFKEKFMSASSSFFDEHANITYTLAIDAFEKIDRSVVMKSEEYELFYNAIYKFLYAMTDKDGVVMGIDNFHSIWEELCFSYVFKHQREDVLFADYEKEANCCDRMYYKECDEKNYPFVVKFGDEEKKIFPDLVMKAGIGTYANKDNKDIGVYFYKKLDKDFIAELSKEHKICLFLEINNWNDGYKYNSFRPYFYVNGNQIELIALERGFDSMYIKWHFVGNEIELTKGDSVPFIEEKIGKNGSYVPLESLSAYKYTTETSTQNLTLYSFPEVRKKICFKLDSIDQFIYDFKYKTKENLNNQDKIKNIFYENCIDHDNDRNNILVLPKYGEDTSLLHFLDDIEIENEFRFVERKNKVRTHYWNFNTLLKDYLS